MEYYKNLDGLRGYSALIVVLFHTNISLFWYGWVGVPFFFVLSGYLITTILFNAKESKNYFKVFYYRRFLRIFPVYYFVVLFGFFYSRYLGLDAKDIPLYLLYIQNFKMGFANWHMGAPDFLNHTWSLAIEEQFYLFFPFVIYYSRNRSVIRFIIVGICGSILLKFLLSFVVSNSPLVWVNTLSQVDFLLVGAFLAYERFYKLDYKKYLSQCLFISFGIYILVTTIHGNRIPFKSPFSITDFMGATFWMLLLFFAGFIIRYLIYNDNVFLRILFQNRVIVFLGRISYGVYLYHYIVFFFINTMQLKSIYVSSLIAIVLTILIASFSFFYFEKTLLKYKYLLNYKF